MKKINRIKLLNFISLFLKGSFMGIANIIPGVSGGTIALITGIYEKLINSLKSINFESFKLLFNLKFKEFINNINLNFLLPIFLGTVIGVLSFAKFLNYLFDNKPILIWSFFFGLILASVFSIIKEIKEVNYKIIFLFLFGSLISVYIGFSNPIMYPNDNYFYIFFCGIIGICGMILPGLSGSYLLILLGNYKLLMIDSMNAVFEIIELIISFNLNDIKEFSKYKDVINFTIFFFGSVFGLIVFSNLLSKIFKKYKDIILAILSGFVFGSLSIIWPWKRALYDNNLFDRNGNSIVVGYERFLPEIFDINLIISIILMLIGFFCVVLTEKIKLKKNDV